MAVHLHRASAATVSFSTPQEIVISHLDDSIKIGDGTNFLTVYVTGDSVSSSPRGILIYGKSTTNTALPLSFDTNGNLKTADQTTTTSDQAVRIDEPSKTVNYFGYASVGTSDAAASWKIKKLVTSGSVTTIQWADGDANYDNIWSNRASLTYN